METWRNGAQNFTSFNGNQFPVRFTEYAGDEEYASFECRRNMAYAFWYMLSKFYGMDGWTRGSYLGTDHSSADSSLLQMQYLNTIKEEPDIIHHVSRGKGDEVINGLRELHDEYESMKDHRYFTNIGNCGTTWMDWGLEIWHGTTLLDYVSPEDYYKTPEARANLNDIFTENPEIKFSMFS